MISTTLPTCGHATCSGHLGKFESCLAEALYEMSMDSADESTGNCEFDGHFSLMLFASDYAYDDSEVSDIGPITVPAGSYIVETTSSGAVYLLTYASEEEARAAFTSAEEAYAAWRDDDDA